MNSAISKGKQTRTSIGSVIFSLLASSHHWLHMVILMLISGSMSSMTVMSGTMGVIVWFRRIMIVATVLSVAYSVYRPIRHKCKNGWIIGVTSIAVVISIGFLVYTLAKFGW